MAPDVRLANRDDAAAIGRLLYAFNREFDEPAPPPDGGSVVTVREANVGCHESS